MINAVNATTPTNNISYVSKPDTIALRPHHFLCLPGYKGYNYNQSAKTSWDIISKQLRENPPKSAPVNKYPHILTLLI